MYDQHAICLNCTSSNLILDHRTGDLICGDCGFVLQGHLIEEGAFWRNHDDAEDKATAGGPLSVRDLLLGEGGLPATGISGGQFNPTSNNNNNKKQSAAQALNQAQRRASRSSKSNRIGKALEELSDIVTRMGLPTSIEDTAMVIFKKFVDVSPTRKKNLQPYVAASVYLACRQNGATRAVREIADATSMDVKELGKKFKEMQRLLESDMGVVRSDEFMSRFCQQLELSPQTTGFCTHVVRKTMDSGIAEGKSPISISAAAIYMVTQYLEEEKRSEKQVMDVTRVSEPTLRAVYKLLRDHKDQLLPPALLEPARLTPNHSPDISPSPSPRSYGGSSALASPAPSVLPSSSPSPPSSPLLKAQSSLPQQPIVLAQPDEEQLVALTSLPQEPEQLDYLLSVPSTPLVARIGIPDFQIVDDASFPIIYQPTLEETAAYSMGKYDIHPTNYTTTQITTCVPSPR